MNSKKIMSFVGLLLVITLIVDFIPKMHIEAKAFDKDSANEAGLSKITGSTYIGDVDGDGSITPKDVTKLRRYLAGGWEVSISISDGDVDGDGSITPKDVTKLRRYLAGGWGVELPVKENVSEPTTVPETNITPNPSGVAEVSEAPTGESEISDTPSPSEEPKISNIPVGEPEISNTPSPSEEPKISSEPTGEAEISDTPSPSEEPEISSEPTGEAEISDTPSPSEEPEISSEPTEEAEISDTPSPSEEPEVSSSPTNENEISETPIPTESINRPYTTKIKAEYNQTEARTMLDKLNKLREDQNNSNIEPLVLDYDLEKVAMQRAAEVAVKFDMNHYRPDGKDYKQTLAENDFDISPRNILYGEVILFGTDDTKQFDDAFTDLSTNADTKKLLLGYWYAAGIGHVRIDETDFWVIVFSDEAKNITYVEPIDGELYVPLNIPDSLLDSVTITYESGDKTVMVGSSVDAPVYIPKAKFKGSEMDEITLCPLAFESEDEYVKALNGKITGLKAGNGTIKANVLGETVTVDIEVIASD